MKKLHLAILFSLAVLTASSQKVYFIYIQTESEQPFFVKMNENVQSSTASGYIIIAKLIDSSYSFSIGFPQNKWPEQNFSVTLNKKDHGYLLKNFGEKGWGLFNLQSLAVQMSITGKASTDERQKSENKDVSAFTDILSKAADDPSLKEKPVQQKAEEKKTEVVVQEVAKKEEPKIEVKEPLVAKPVEIIEAPVVKTEQPKAETKEIPVATGTAKPVETIDQPVVKKEDPKPETKEQSVIQTEEAKIIVSELYKTSLVRKWAESSTTEGFGLVFIDDYENGTKDTIRLVIPNPKPVVIVEKEEPKEEKKFLDINTETAKKEEEKITEVKPATATIESPEAKTVFKNNCSEIASESDFFKLRKRMAAAESDDDMISEARKYFKAKCFRTEQIKNIGTLFLTDEGKYKFFDAAYKYVSNVEAFNSLQTELKDEYYLSRFKAMLRN